MEYNIPAKPTIYKNTEFRSRLEARWAAFFDLLGWRWQYEPYDLNGWTPDFIVYGSDGRYILFEVKPFLEIEIILEYHKKIQKAIKHKNINCILLINEFKQYSDETAIVAGSQVSAIYDIIKPIIVHWKHSQSGINSEYDIGSNEQGMFEGLLWYDQKNRKRFVSDDTTHAYVLKSLWLKAGVLSTFHYE